MTDEQETLATQAALNAWSADPSVPIADVVRDIVRDVLKAKLGDGEPEQLPRDQQLAYFRVLGIAAQARIAWLDNGSDQQLREVIVNLREILGMAGNPGLRGRPCES